MATNQSQYEEMCEVCGRYNKGDLVPVVRCKDCVYSSVIPKEMQNVGEWCCEFWYAEMHEDDYCSCGKRRKDGAERK